MAPSRADFTEEVDAALRALAGREALTTAHRETLAEIVARYRRLSREHGQVEAARHRERGQA